MKKITPEKIVKALKCMTEAGDCIRDFRCHVNCPYYLPELRDVNEFTTYVRNKKKYLNAAAEYIEQLE